MNDMTLEEDANIQRQYHMKINMLSPERVLELSSGEVATAETLNYKNYHPASDGLFSEKIFGPIKDWECRCGKYKNRYYAGVVCDRCGVEVTTSNVRRERFGHIELNCNIVLPQYFYGAPSILATVLDIPQKYLEQIVLSDLEVDTDGYYNYENKMQALVDKNDALHGYHQHGTEALKSILESVNLEEELNKINEILDISYGYLAQPYLHRKEVIESFINSGNKPEWMITSRLLVLPAGLRPIVEYQGKKYSSEINDRYRILIERNRLLGRLLNMSAPDVVLKSQKRMIQVAIDALFDSKLEKEDYGKAIHESLISRRQKTINRYIDYSASGMVIADNSIDIEKIGVPEYVVNEIFRPFIAYDLVEKGLAHNVKSAFKIMGKCPTSVAKTITDLSGTFVVLACTNNNKMTALNVQITNNDCFSVNPIVYRLWDIERFNNKSVRLFAQLSDESAEEVIEKFGVQSQIVSAYTDEVQMLPSRYAISWLSQMSKINFDNNRRFISKGEAYCAYENDCLRMTEKIIIHCHTANGFDYEEETSLGRIIINEFLPQNMGNINRASLKNKYYLEHNREFEEDDVIYLLNQVYEMFGSKKYLEVLKEYEKVMNRYYNAVQVECENSVYPIQRMQNSEYFKFEIQSIKDISSNLQLSDVSTYVMEVRIKYQDQDMNSYMWKWIRNRVVAEDIYDFADILISKGEVISYEVYQKLLEKNVYKISIYESEITQDGKYSRIAYGKSVKGNPFKVAVMAVIDVIDRVDYWTAVTFFKILLSDGIIELDDKLKKIIEFVPKEGFIWTLLMESYNSVEHEINLSSLNKNGLVQIKTYILMKLLGSQNVEISLRLLELLIKACVHGLSSKYDERSIILRTPKNDLRKFGEYALKTSTIPFDSEEMVGTYGKINIGTESEPVQKYKDEKHDDIGFDEFNNEDLYVDDDELFEDFK